MKTRSSALRRRRKPSLATRLRIAWVFIAMVVGAAVYAGYFLVTMPQLRVRTIDVTIDGFAVTQREVLAAANIDRRANVWLTPIRVRSPGGSKRFRMLVAPRLAVRCRPG